MPTGNSHSSDNEFGPAIRNSLFIISCALVVVGIFLAWFDKTASAVACFSASIIYLMLALLSRFRRFKGFGIEAEMWEQKQEEAAKIVEQLRDFAAQSSKVTVTELMAGAFLGGLSLSQRLNLYDELMAKLEGMGLTDTQLNSVRQGWRAVIDCLYITKVRTLLGPKFPKDIVIKDAFDEWSPLSPNELRARLTDSGVLTDTVSQIIADYEYFRRTGIIRNREDFAKGL